MKDNVIRLPKVQGRTGLSRSTIYDWANQGLFPSPIKLGKNSVGWLESEVEAWLEARVAESRGKANNE